MAFFTKLSNVTEAIKELIRQNLIVRFGETSSTFAVTAAPPDATATEPTVSVYLFHVIEDPFRKNAPPVVGTGSVPVRHAPMGLSLFYVITVLSELSTEDDVNAKRQQELIGYVAKTIHDFPVISENTKIGGSPIFPPDVIERNTIELILRPVKIEETINFWSTQEARTPKLALFVEARVVLLEPERPEASAGIVLSVGQFIFPSGAPHIAQTKSTVAFFPPGANPAVDPARTIAAVPARITILSNVPATPAIPTELEDNNLLTIEGSGFTGFKRTLTLRVRGTTLRVNMDDETQNGDWDFERGASTITLRFRDTVVDVEGTTKALIPGVYTARVSVSEQLSGPLVPRSTNEVAFTVSPQIIDVTETSAVWTLTISGGYLDPDEVEIQLAVGGLVLDRTETLPPSGDAYRVVDGSTLEFQLANPPGAGEFQVVQLSVNGTIAPPWWIEEP